MTGKELKDKVLGLSKMKTVYVQRILQTGTPTFVFTFDSHFKYLPLLKVLKNPVHQIRKIKVASGQIRQKKIRMSTPLRLDSISQFPIKDGAVYILNDIAGVYYRNKKLYESVQSGYNVLYI
jgi:hypothetical protein